MSSNHLIEELKKQIGNFQATAKREEIGTVLEVGDGVARVAGLANVMSSEMVVFETGAVDRSAPSLASDDAEQEVYGVARNIEEEQVGVMILGDARQVREGSVVKSTGRLLSMPVGENVIGRVVNALGTAIDGRGTLAVDEFLPMEKVAPGVMTRQSVHQPLQTGIKAIDALIPVGRGQRELIIGDRQTGKTAIAIDTILNQKGTGVLCIYVAIGQKESKVARIVAELEKGGAMAYTSVVVAGVSEPAALSFIAPYAGCALAEFFLAQGKDVLVVYDDLSKHAAAYRQISLILRRPPGREAFPGDVFYLHSRLLERSAKLNADNGGGSITALPIIETQAGDVSAYIPTNVISITDGQIYLESDLFYKGIRPALNVGLSVSRVGGSAQIKAMKQVAGTLRLDLAQFRELEAFASFGSDLDEKTRQQLERGRRGIEILKQGQYAPLPVEHEVAILYALTRGHLDTVPVEKITTWEAGFHKYLDTQAKSVLESIITEKVLTPEVEEGLKKAIGDFHKSFVA